MVGLWIEKAPTPEPRLIEASPAACTMVPKVGWIAPPLSAASPFVIVMELAAPVLFDASRMWNGWPVVPSSGGWRKARFAPPTWGVGKSGGVRVYYADLPEFGLMLLGTAFAKSEMTDLAAKDKKALGGLLAVYRRLFQGDS